MPALKFPLILFDVFLQKRNALAKDETNGEELPEGMSKYRLLSLHGND
jgi:hypothetical protein